MDWTGGFAAGTEGVMNTRPGQHHKMKLVEVQRGRFFALETRAVPGTRFRFNCKVDPAVAGASISQAVEVLGPLGAVMGGMMGPRVSKEFGILLSNLARKAQGG